MVWRNLFFSILKKTSKIIKEVYREADEINSSILTARYQLRMEESNMLTKTGTWTLKCFV